MRIQHNIMAMNAYRNYTNNTSALSKNLEKLSSGYKINRAGDDAAGLAISEKMRAQITGLDVAQKNAKDGISLVQTAEGALTEVHDMLNRMYELAEQSANGTYQDDVDRDNLQAELNALREEIDRISQSANFNGIKLFTQGGAAGGDVATDVAVTLGTGAANGAALSDVSFAFASGATSEAKKALIDALGSKGAEISFKLSTGWSDGGKITLTGLPKGYTFTFGSGAGGTAAVSGSGVIDIGQAASSGKLGSTADLVLHMKGTDGKEVATLTIKKAAGVTAGTSKITLAPKAAADASGAKAATLSTGSTASAAGPEFTLASSAKTKFGIDSVDFAKAGLSITATTAVKMAFSSTGEKLTITVGTGSKAVTFSATINKKKASLAGQTVTLSDGNGKTVSVKIANPTQLGTDAVSITADTLGTLKPANNAAGSGTDSGTITLQIGEDGNTYNQLTFNKRGISTADLGIDKGSINIDTQQNALAALSSIKTAINTISSIRGDLGAIQNRLDHTINNLSVMQENIQDAESTIRDTDVADEMMAYTKNNILVQSAQAMLAQANQVPQGVLQLLQ